MLCLVRLKLLKKPKKEGIIRRFRSIGGGFGNDGLSSSQAKIHKRVMRGANHLRSFYKTADAVLGEGWPNQ
jgi:hypothetical protein